MAVLPKEGKATDIGSDGVVLDSPVPLLGRVMQYEAARDDQSFAALAAYRSLLVGMLSTDGIVIIDSQCGIVGYNFFIRSEPDGIARPSLTKPEGGARHRAYHRMREFVDRKVLRACFMQSSDGSSDFYKG